jgi:hypothetical protein
MNGCPAAALAVYLRDAETEHVNEPVRAGLLHTHDLPVKMPAADQRRIEPAVIGTAE